MEGKQGKMGWVEKKSAYLKQWRMRWMVLANGCLCTYKTENTSETPTERILLTAILEVSHLDSDPQRPHSFRVSTRSRVYCISTARQDLARDWVSFIQSSLLQAATPNNQLIEKQKQSQQSLEGTFASLLTILDEREAHLKSDLDSYHTSLLSKAREELAIFHKSAAQCEANFAQFLEVQARTDLPITEKLRLVNVMCRETDGFQEFDRASESIVKVSVPAKETLTEMMSGSVSVSIENPNEFKARRTFITRALKWRYNGERIDALSFSVSKAILLTAIGLCRPYKPGGRIEVKELKVAQGNSTNSSIIYTHPGLEAIESSSRDSVQKVSLGTPQTLRPGVVYTLLVKLDGSTSYKCVDCFRTITTEGDVSWSFFGTIFQSSELSNRTDAVCGPIADFYYMMVVA